jgi:hypothetical protein
MYLKLFLGSRISALFKFSVNMKDTRYMLHVCEYMYVGSVHMHMCLIVILFKLFSHTVQNLDLPK